MTTLDRIGTIIYFGQNEALKDWIILDPQWIKDALCNVLDSDRIKEGIFDVRDFSLIWGKYSNDEHQKLMQLLLAYELAYLQKDKRGNKQYIIPSMLNKTPIPFPNHLSTPDVQIRFTYQPFIPAGTVSKLMVRLHQYIYNDLKWKNNLVLHHPETNTYAHIYEQSKMQQVYIHLFGENVSPLYILIYQELKQINTNLKNARFIKHLDFEVEAFNDGEWDHLKILQKYKVPQFCFLWETNHFIKTEKIFDTLEQIKTLIASNKLEQALDELLAMADDNHKNELTLLKARYIKLEEDTRIDIISSENARLERNKITNSILKLIERLSLNA